MRASNAPIWEVRHSLIDEFSIWALFDHALDDNGQSHQFRFGARKIKSRRLYEAVLKDCVAGERAVSILLLSQSGPDQRELLNSSNPESRQVELVRGQFEFLLVEGEENDGIVSAFLARNGSDPDDVPDFLWFPAITQADTYYAATCTILGGMHNDRIDEASDNPFKLLRSVLRDSSVALMLDGHLYLVSRNASDSGIREAIIAHAKSSNLLVPLPFPPLRDDDPLGTYLRDDDPLA